MYNIEKLTQLTAELEGLLHVLNRRDSDNIRALLRNKYSDFTSEFDNLLDSLSEKKYVQAQLDFEDIDNQLSNIEVKDQEAVDSEVDDEMDASVKAVEREESFDNVSDELNEDESKGLSEIEPHINDAIKEEPDYNYESDINEFDSEQQTSENNVSAEVKRRFLEHEITSEMKVDQMLTRKEASDLKRVFTLNDKFRFRRALFNQDDALFSATLNRLAQIPTYEQAQDYLINELGWNPDNIDVEDFLLIIKPHYE